MSTHEVDTFSSGPLRASAHGAHITSWASPAGEVFFVSRDSLYQKDKAIRGGIPICAPYFGGLLGKKPAHGFARISTWDTTRTDDGFTAQLSKQGYELTFDAHARNDRLSITLRLINKKDTDATVQLGFHPYFATANCLDTTVSGLGDLATIDPATHKLGTVPGTIGFDKQGCDFVVNNDGRTATVSTPDHTVTISTNATQFVVWNPGEKLVEGFGDLANDEWSSFVCVEPAILGKDLKGVTLAAGDSLELSARITVN